MIKRNLALGEEEMFAFVMLKIWLNIHQVTTCNLVFGKRHNWLLNLYCVNMHFKHRMNLSLNSLADPNILCKHSQ